MSRFEPNPQHGIANKRECHFMESQLLSTSKDLIVFLDAFPSEQLQHSEETQIAVACVICLPPNKPRFLRQYKDVAPRKRTRVAKKLSKQFRKNDPWVASIIITAKQSKWRELGLAALDSIPSGYIRKVKRGAIKIGKNTLGKNVAEAMGLYALTMVYSGLWVSQYAREMDRTNIVYMLDKLPSNSAGAMELLKIISHSSNLHDMWKQTLGLDLTFQTGNLERVEDKNKHINPFLLKTIDLVGKVFPFLKRIKLGKKWSGNDYPAACVADWMAQSFFAANSPNEWLHLGQGRRDSHRKAIANLWFTLREHSEMRSKIISLDSIIPN
jgi:hypothetical protein